MRREAPRLQTQGSWRFATVPSTQRDRCVPMPEPAAPVTLCGMADAELPEPLDVIAVGAHPDDVEIAAGGTLARLSKLGYRVGIVDLTDGEPTPGSPGPEVRAEEAKRAAETLGVHVRLNLDQPNRRLFDSYEHRVELAKVFRRYRPRLVMGIAGETPMASPDHWQAMQITDAAVFYSRLCKWDDQFDHLPVHTVTKQVWFPLGLASNILTEGRPRLLADISDTLETKLQAVRAYATQFPPAKERVFRMVEGHNKTLGAMAGYVAAEVFLTAAPHGVGDLFASLMAEPDRSLMERVEG